MEKIREPNPFEDPQIAEEWIRSVEGEKGLIRDKEIYPTLQKWAELVKKDGTIVEIGSGQGACSEHLGDFHGHYIGVEPSEVLTERGKSLYGSNNQRSFVMGNAYNLPVRDNSVDGAFSVNVWFHLADLAVASNELARILKVGGRFNIITANPDAYDVWKEFYEDYTVEGKLLSGKVRVPINPMTRNDFYMHAHEEIIDSLQINSLEIVSVQPLGTMSTHSDKQIFVSIQGCRK